MRLQSSLAIATSVAAVCLSSVASAEVADEPAPRTWGTAQPPAPQVVAPPPPAERPPTSTTTTTAALFERAPANADMHNDQVKPNLSLVVFGSSMFAASYLTAVILGAASSNSADNYLFIPIAGPWIDIGERTCPPSGCLVADDWNAIGLGALGVVQAAGLVTMIGGFFTPETVTKKPPAKPTARVVPMSMGRGGSGIGAVGQF